MSEIRRTKTVEVDDSQPNESRVTLADLLAGVGWLAYQGTRLAVKGTVAGAKLTAKAVKAAHEYSQTEPPPPLTVSRANRIVNEAPDTGSALRDLAAQPGLAIPAVETDELRLRLQQLSPASSKTEVVRFAEEMIRARQDRLHVATLRAASDACTAIGFKPKALKSVDGLIAATGADGGRKITVEVEKTTDGELRMHFDAHGFRGGDCIRTLDALQDELAARGVRCRLESRRRKDRSPAFDATRLPDRRQIRPGR